MDAGYETYFRDRLAGIWGFREATAGLNDNVNDPDARAHGMVREGLEQCRRVAIDRGQELRGDGEMLLYLAFVEVVARPILTVRPDASDELADDIQADMVLVARRAAPEGEAISAHAVVNSVSQSWSDLRSARWQLWD